MIETGGAAPGPSAGSAGRSNSRLDNSEGHAYTVVNYKIATLMKNIDLRPALRDSALGIGTLALLLSVIFLAMRAYGTMGPPAARALMALMCLAMAALPWVLLSAHGRDQIGLRRPRDGAWSAAAIGVSFGVTMATLSFALGYLLYGQASDNWFVSVANSYRSHPTAGFSLLQLHLTFTSAALLFSPIGEELFFRGFLQKVLEERLTPLVSTCVQSGLFALVHLCHHGILATAAGLMLLPLSAALWVLLMFGLSLGLSWLRRASDSLLPAVLGHAAFNAAMNGFIFACLWRN